MTPFTILRVAAVIALLQGMAHGLKHVTYAPVHGPAERALVDAMQNDHFTFAGFDRTYWGFYFGYGLMVAFTCVLQAVLLWMLAALAKSEPARLRPILGLMFCAYLGHGALALEYFFLKPVAFDLLIVVCLAIGFVLAGRRSPASIAMTTNAT